MSGYVCPECGLAYDTVSPNDALVAIRSFPRRYRGALAAALEDETEQGLVRRRPEPEVWSALEYTLHVADIMDAMAGVVRAMRLPGAGDPAGYFFDSDARVTEDRYNEQDPQQALDRLAAGAERFAAEVQQVPPDDWSRTSTFPWGERDILTMVRNGVHEGSHHLRDVEKVLQQARTGAAGAPGGETTPPPA